MFNLQCSHKSTAVPHPEQYTVYTNAASARVRLFAVFSCLRVKSKAACMIVCLYDNGSFHSSCLLSINSGRADVCLNIYTASF